MVSQQPALSLAALLTILLAALIASSWFNGGGDQPGAWPTVHKTPTGDYDVTLHFRRAQLAPSPDMPNITLVAHATIDRLHAVARWCRTLRGPLSISVFVRPFVDDVAAVMGAFVADECIARHADLHLVTERRHRYEPREDGGKDMMTHYPFNVQRNAALDGCVGDLALLMDIDFHLMPVPNNREVDLRYNFEIQRRKVASWPFLADEPWVLHAAMYVIPAVETVVAQLPLPTTMEELTAQVAQQQAVSFYGHYCKFCHLPTNLKHFLRASDPYLVEFVEGYEPYVIVNKSSRALDMLVLPKYEEVFVGRGYDKMSFFYELHMQQRPFIVIPGAFIVHAGRGDLPSFFKPASAEYNARQVVNRKLMDTFMKSAKQKYRYAMRISTAAVRRADQVAATAASSHETEFDERQRAMDPSVQLRAADGENHPHASPSRNQQTVDSHHLHESEVSSTATLELKDKILWESTRMVDWSMYASSAGFSVVCVLRSDAEQLWAQQQKVEDARRELEKEQKEEEAAAKKKSSLFASDPLLAMSNDGITDDNDATTSTQGDAAAAAETKEEEWIPEFMRPDAPATWENSIKTTLWWVCARMNCDGLTERYSAASSLLRSGAPHLDGAVSSPSTMLAIRELKEPALTADARWVFDRWFHLSVGRGTQAHEACDFKGFAAIVSRKQSLLGCTVDPRRELPVARLEAIKEELCSNTTGNLGSSRCAFLLEHRVHPMLRSSMRVQVSVLLNAHHLIFEGAGVAGHHGLPTCDGRFPGVAVQLAWQKHDGASIPVATGHNGGDSSEENFDEDDMNRYLTVSDALLLRATESLDWNAVSNHGRGIYNVHKEVDAQLQVAEGRTCISSFRLPLLNARYNRTAHLESIRTAERAMAWTCGRLNCGHLQIDRATGPLLRHYPRNIVTQADWIVGRWFYEALLSGETVTQACHFGGAARLARVSAYAQDMPKDVVGCTVNPEHPTSRSQLIALVQEICNDPPPIVLEKNEDGEEIRDEVGLAEEGAAIDRIGGGCQALFSHIDPMVRDDWSVRASVALNAHHLIFFAGGEGSTCRRRFGNVAAYLRL
ncbi:glycosyltransferase-like, putative [Bodo saltans]|uniref:Glycosyltransferase-like, putative n=1 Tax=Bodo saltans TaxID=75058 RepID=A0A0S4JQC3_BODSA|nr:glycosyltransferase-like, putative [Bodo saltans]|eukprot:CUG93703.1 glycosyltransferase-like, putative [Bodo saltans]